jgi:hypothetical protein
MKGIDHSKTRHREKDIKTDDGETGWEAEDWIHLNRDRD